MDSFNQNVLPIRSDQHLRLNHFALSQNFVLVVTIAIRCFNEGKLNIMKHCLLGTSKSKCYVVVLRVLAGLEKNIVVDCWRLVSYLDLVKSRVVLYRNSRVVNRRWVV